MARITSWNTAVFAAGFLGLTLLPGAWTIAHTPAPELAAGVMSGATQRHYQAHFDDSFPWHDAMRQAWVALKFGLLGEMAEGALRGQNGVLFTAEEFTAPPMDQDFATALSAAHAQISQAGARLIPVIVPDKARLLPQALPHRRSAHFEARYDRLLQIIAAEGLPVVDLRPALAAPGAFMATDTHWSPEGARAVADEIARHLPAPLHPRIGFATTQTGTRAFDGDLLPFADTGRWRALVGPVFEQINTYTTSAPATDSTTPPSGLFGAVETPVALVGTSFSARAAFHFPGFLKSSLSADVLSFALEGRGPFVPMTRFLHDGGLTQSAPQLVVWELPERYLETWSSTQ